MTARPGSLIGRALRVVPEGRVAATPSILPGPMTLEVDRLAKRFGSVVALDGLSFEAPRGHVFGFLGANGAGKTTTMRIALGVLRGGRRRRALGRPLTRSCRGRRGATCPRSAASTRG